MSDEYHLKKVSDDVFCTRCLTIIKKGDLCKIHLLGPDHGIIHLKCPLFSPDACKTILKEFAKRETEAKGDLPSDDSDDSDEDKDQGS